MTPTPAPEPLDAAMVRRAAEEVRALRPGKFHVDGGRRTDGTYWLVLHDTTQGTWHFPTRKPTANSTRVGFLRRIRWAIARGAL